MWSMFHANPAVLTTTAPELLGGKLASAKQWYKRIILLLGLFKELYVYCFTVTVVYEESETVLYLYKDINRTTKIKSVRGKEKEAIDVFALSLEKLKSKFLETVESSDGR